MRVAANPRPAATSGASGNPRNDKMRSDGNNSGGSDGQSGKSGNSGGGVGKGGYDDDTGSEKTAEQEPGRGSKDGGPNTEEIKTIDDVRIPLAGRGWTFWL